MAIDMGRLVINLFLGVIIGSVLIRYIFNFAWLKTLEISVILAVIGVGILLPVVLFRRKKNKSESNH